MILEKTNSRGVVARYTTPVFSFKMSRFAAENIVNAELILKACGSTVLHKDFSSADVNTATNVVSWTLTQEESGSLPEGKKLAVYFRWLLEDGTCGRGKYSEVQVVESGSEEVMTNGE